MSIAEAHPAPAPTSGRLARHRRALVWTLAVVAVLLAVAVVNRDDATQDGRLDPRNPDADGAQAVARVLEDRGVDVRIARGQESLRAEQVTSSTTVVVTNPEALGPSTLSALRRHADDAAAVVLVGDARVLGALLDVDAVALGSGVRPADCDEALVRDLTVRTRGGEGLRAPGCFGDAAASALVRRDQEWYLASPASISNRRVLQEDDAALALRLLGQGDELVWYVADPTDLAADEGFSLTRLLPPWLGPSGVLLAVSVLALMVWRGRRLGPLVTEPLPVVVRAVEATRGRGRIYRRAGDQEHAARILREATRRRLVDALRLPPRTAPEDVADAAARRTGRDVGEVRDLLVATDPSSGTVGTHARLVDLGRRLVELEDQVRIS